MNRLQSDTSKEDTKTTELITREDIEDSPFTIIGIEGKRYFGAMGQYRITEEFINPEIVRNELKEITWNRIVQVMMIIVERNDHINDLIAQNEDAVVN